MAAVAVVLAVVAVVLAVVAVAADDPLSSPTSYERP
jgi:hypothetical protein